MSLKICDFGFARILPDSKIPLTNYVATRWYRSPELLMTQYYGKGSDIWAIGCILYEITTGEPLFPGNDHTDQCKLIEEMLGINFYRESYDGKFRTKKKQIKNNNLKELLLMKLSKDGVNLLESMLQVDPKKRISANDALNHIFFEPLLAHNTNDKIGANNRVMSSDNNKLTVKSNLKNKGKNNTESNSKSEDIKLKNLKSNKIINNYVINDLKIPVNKSTVITTRHSKPFISNNIKELKINNNLRSIKEQDDENLVDSNTHRNNEPSKKANYLPYIEKNKTKVIRHTNSITDKTGLKFFKNTIKNNSKPTQKRVTATLYGNFNTKHKYKKTVN